MRSIIAIIFLLLVIYCDFSLCQNNYDVLRAKMVKEQIENRQITDESVLNAMNSVKRHLFIPSDLRYRAYNDGPVPIGYGQTISQPYIVAYMTQAIHPKPNSKILEIGTGSGYQAAVLAEIVDSVYTIEIIQELGTSATKRFKTLGYENVNAKISDGYYGWEEHAPFDAIVVTAAAEYIPSPLINQLKNGGKMIIPVGSPFHVQTLILVTKKNDKVTTENLFPVRFVPFTRQK